MTTDIDAALDRIQVIGVPPGSVVLVGPEFAELEMLAELAEGLAQALGRQDFLVVHAPDGLSVLDVDDMRAAGWVRA